MSEKRASRQGVKVVVLYSSLSGNTRAMAEHVAAGVRLAPGAEAVLMDAGALDMAAAEQADGIAIGSPNYYSYVSGLVKHFFDLAFQNAAFKGKPYVAFSTHGGGGGVSAILDRLAKSLGMKRVGEGLDILGAPGGDQVKACRKLGQVLATASA